MAVSVTVRDIVNFPGGTAKTVSVDVLQIVPKGTSEGDEQWVATASTTATASGGGAIQSIFKTDLKRGFIKSSGLKGGSFNIAASTGMVIAIDQAIGLGVTITLATGNNILGVDVAQDIETKLQSQAVIGGGGAKIGNLSYLNCQVRFINNKFIIESGTVANTFTGTGKSSVVVGAPPSGTDARTLLGFDVPTSSETLAGRQLVETDITATYTAGDVLTMTSTANLATGDPIMVYTNSLVSSFSQAVVVSGVLSSSQVRFVTASGLGTNLSATLPIGSVVRKMEHVDQADPVSAITTVDQLYRFALDSLINQINFGA